MKFEAVRIHFLSEVFGLLSYKFMPPWQRDVTTSPLYCHTLLELSNHLNEHQMSWSCTMVFFLLLEI